jgi:hypothetical protein
MTRKLKSSVIFLFILTLIILAACGTQPGNMSTPEAVMLLGTPVMISNPETEEAALTQASNDADAQAAATAKVLRANALAALNSANATLGAAQTQDQNAADLIAAQVAATAAVVRANAQATLDSAGATQNAAFTQDAIHQTQAAALATTDAVAALNQQNKDKMVGGTQTAIANLIATQTQSAAATSQWYTDQGRQRTEQLQGPLTFLGLLCLPSFIVILAGSALWAYWRWVKIKQGPRILKNPVEALPAPVARAIVQQQDDSSLYLDHIAQPTKPDEQVDRWLNEVKSELLSAAEKDKDDNANH